MGFVAWTAISRIAASYGGDRGVSGLKRTLRGFPGPRLILGTDVITVPTDLFLPSGSRADIRPDDGPEPLDEVLRPRMAGGGTHTAFIGRRSP